MTDDQQCEVGKSGIVPTCPKPARAAIKTTDGTRFTSTLYYDDRGAPTVATRYCKEHAVATILALSMDIIPND